MERRIPLYDDAELGNPGLVGIGGDLVVNHLHDHALADCCGCLARGWDCEGATLELADSGVAFGLRFWCRVGSGVFLDPLPESVIGSTTKMGFGSRGERDWTWPEPEGHVRGRSTTSE